MNNKIKLLALFGPSSCGKDTLINYMDKKFNNINKVISSTTREKRDYEIEGKDYYFISKEEFAKEVINGNMLEATSWGGDFYGSNISAFDKNKINIMAIDMVGIECLLSDPRIEIIPILIMVEDKVRLIRALEREQNPNCEKICKRFLEDKEKFETEFDFDYYTYYNGNSVDLNSFITFLSDRGLLTPVETD